MLVECKSSGKAKYTKAQEEFLSTWKGGMVARVHDLDGVVTLINVLNKIAP